MIDLREKKTSKKEDEKEIKFINKGDEFKSDKADTVKIIDVDKKDDKTEVTYKLGDEEKKGDIEDVLKMLNGAEYSKVEDKKDDDKKESAVVEAEGKKFVIYCTSKNEKDIPSGYVGDNDNYKTLKDLIAAEGKDVFFDSEKKAKDLIDDDPTIQANIKDGAKYTVKDVTDDLDEKKESAEDDSVEVILAEDFHVPGTDVILEAGDVIRVVPKKVVESKSDDKENMLELIIDYVQENGLTDTYNFKQLISLLKDVVKDFENAEDMLY